MNFAKEHPEMIQIQQKMMNQLKDSLESLAGENDDTTVAVRTDSRQQTTGASGSDRPTTSKSATHRYIFTEFVNLTLTSVCLYRN